MKTNVYLGDNRARGLFISHLNLRDLQTSGKIYIPAALYPSRQEIYNLMKGLE
jgi:hypothetical protein